jgi:hypothetical protein
MMLAASFPSGSILNTKPYSTGAKASYSAGIDIKGLSGK